MKLVLIRHSKTKSEPNVNPLLWKLSDEGIELAKSLSKKDYIKNIGVIYSSFQTKAVETSLLLAKDNFIHIKFDNSLTELTSITNGFIPNYEESVEKLYKGSITSINKGETLEQGLDRFNKTIKQIVFNEKDKNIIGIVAHCNILSLFSAQFINKSALEIHNSMDMPDVAIFDWESKKFINFYGELE